MKPESHNLTLSHLDKILFPESQITKQDLITYYTKISPLFLPHVKDRLIVMQRFPRDIHEGFFQKEVPDYFPSLIKRATIPLKKGSVQTLLLINTESDLIYLANQSVITMHPWLSNYQNPYYPTKLVFDLDPSPESDIKQVRFAVREVKKMLEKYGLVTYLMTTGSRGYHVVAPIKPTHDFDTVHAFAKNIANTLAQQHPDDCTVTMSKSGRDGKVFIDYLRNAYGQTSVAPYCVRAQEGAPIATPLDWSELATTLPQKYRIKNIFKRLARKQDPWKNFEKNAQELRL